MYFEELNIETPNYYSTNQKKKISLLTIIAVALALAPSLAWTKVKDERMSGLNMRIVNEGIAHDDQYWFFSNQHLLYRVSYDLWIITYIEWAN